MSNNDGLQQRYYVRKLKQERDQRGEMVDVMVDPGPVFVLDYKKDRHARAALRRYAESCAADYPQLANDLLKQLDSVFEIVDGQWVMKQLDPNCPSCECGGQLCSEHGTGKLQEYGK